MEPLPTPSRNLLQTYEDLLVSNLGSVRSIESGIRNISWLLPGRFHDAELASEGLSGYHDSLLSKHLDPALHLPPHPFGPYTHSQTEGGSGSEESMSKTTPVLPPPSDHARYTRYWSEKSGLYRRISRLLSTIGYVELLVEMLARKRGDRHRWSVVLGLETVKTTLRLILMIITKRPVLSPPTPQREYDLLSLPSAILNSKSKSSPSSGFKPSSQSEPTTEDPLPPHAALTPTLPPYAPLRSHLFPMTTALPEEHLPHPLTLLPTMTTSEAIGEIIQDSVTLIHVLLLVRSARRRNTAYTRYSLPTLSSQTSPYLITILLCLLARRLRRSDSRSLLLAEHYAQLDKKLAARAFLTGPMWIGWTRPKVMRVIGVLNKVPIVSIAGEFVEGYLPLVDEYFYYSS